MCVCVCERAHFSGLGQSKQWEGWHNDHLTIKSEVFFFALLIVTLLQALLSLS